MKGESLTTHQPFWVINCLKADSIGVGGTRVLHCYKLSSVISEWCLAAKDNVAKAQYNTLVVLVQLTCHRTHNAK